MAENQVVTFNRYKWLYKFAWAFEVVAALTGLAMAAVFNAPAYLRYSEDGLDATEITFLIGGSLPFFMIAFAELCKIPLVTSTIIAKTQMTKLLFGVVTFFACFITFETVYNGLEQTQAQRSLHIFEYNAQLDNLYNRVETINNRILVASEKDEKTVNAEIKELKEKAYKSFEMRKAILDDEINKIEEIYSGKLKNIVKPLEDQIIEIEERESANSESASRQIKNLQLQINSTKDTLKDYEEKLQKCGFFSGNCGQLNREGIKTNTARLESLEKKLTQVSDRREEENPKINRLLNEIASAKSKIQKSKDEELSRVTKKIAKADQSLQDELNNIRLIEKNKTNKLNTNVEKISDSQESLDEIYVTIDNIREKKAIDVNTNLIYRLAGRWFGVSAGDVTEKQASIIGTIWNASISIIVAIMGPIIAAAFILLNFQFDTRPKSTFRAVAKAIRSHKRKPKVIEKIVEVEKEVEKKIYVDKLVEVEIEKPIIKHVPIFTDDPTLIELSKEWKKN